MPFIRPGIRVRLKATKPEIEADQGTTLGACLRRRRRELGLKRYQAMEALGVSYKTLMWWEQDEREPFVHFWPAIVSFLGYEPWPKARTLGEHLTAERRRRGLARKEAVAIMDVDEATLWRWETGQWKPTVRTVAKLDGFLGMSCRQAFPDEVRGG